MQKTLKSVFSVMAVIIAVLAVIFLLWYFRSVVFYIFIAAVVSMVGRPLFTIFKKVHIRKKKMPNWLAAALSLLSLWAVAVAFFAIFIPLIFGKLSALGNLDIQSMLSSLQEPISRLETFMRTYFAIEVNSATIAESFSKYISQFFNLHAVNTLVTSLVSVVVKAGIGIFAVTFISFFFLKDENLFLRIILAIVPDKYCQNIKHTQRTVARLLSRYFIGILAESTIIMLIVAIALICCGYTVSTAFFIGIIIGVLNVIPYVGPWLGFGVSLLVSIAFLSSGMSFPFIFFSLAITVMSAQFIDNFFIQPLLYSNSVHATPLEIFIVILMAGKVGGILGMILAIPAYTVLRVIGREFFAHIKIVRKLTSSMGD